MSLLTLRGDTGALENFHAWFAQWGLAVILISHRLQDIMTVCDRVVVMKSGALVRDLNVRTTDIDEIVKLMVSGGEMGAMPKASATAWSDHPTAQPPA